MSALRKLITASSLRFIVAMALVLSVFASVTNFIFEPAVAATGYRVVSGASGRCLEVADHMNRPAAAVQIWDCHGQSNQLWTFTAEGELRTFDNAMCLDVPSHDVTPPAHVQIYPCHGGANQQWRISADGTIVGVESNLCLDVEEAGTANRTPVIMWTCHGRSNQKWVTSAGDSWPPTPPGNPRTSNLTCDSVTLSWNASSDNVGVAQYDVYHDGQHMKTVSGTTVSTNLTVVPGATWGLYVNARDAAGNVSQASATVTITPPYCQDDTQAPTAPTNLAGSAEGTAVTLTWTASQDNVGVTGYDIYRNGTEVGTVSGSPPATMFTDSGLAASTTYQYYVVARDAQGNTSARSATISVTTGAACTNPVCGVTEVATESDLPWGLVTLPNGSILYTRRDAHDIIQLNPTTGARTSLGTVPNASSTDGEGGLLGLEISPSFATDGWLYIMHTSPSDNRIVRIKVENNRLNTATTQVLIAGIGRNKYHNGGRLRFGPDGKLYAATGDAQNGNYAQDRNNLSGKILRLNPDGSVPTDNPFGNAVWSYGHRNPQGLAFDSQGRLWAQEFGNAVMDETNLIQRGGNYGWPTCEGTSGSCDNPGFIAPKYTYPTAQGSCSGIAIVRDVLYVACLRGARMYRAVISGSSLTNVQQYFNGTYGRLRTVEPAPGGGLWLTTSNHGDKDSTPNNSNEKILRVTLGS